MTEIKTERLILKNITESDANDIFEYSKNPNVGPNAGWKPHESLEETKEIMKIIFLGQDSVFGMVLPESGKLIGTLGLLPDQKREYDKAMMLGYAMGEQYWNKGYMTEAAKAVIKYGFEELGLELISCCCYPFNAGSMRVIEKCGFRFEGVMRMAEKIFNGNVYDHRNYSLTKGEYLKLTEKKL